ncbi:MAG: GntR family transcriptional regulator [Erysipelotrichaceae bacterium]|nr:GntR family transcriptional regulator [Erysipelotrichaceae bacterium]
MSGIRIHATIRQQIFEILRDRIMEGYYPAGTRLSEQQICDEFNISRSPVREAFRNLESSGLLKGTANKGVQVKSFTAHDITNLYQAETMFQITSIQNGVSSMTEEQAASFEKYRTLFTDAYNSENLEQYLSVSEKFHNDITALGQNELIIQMYRQIGTLNHRFRLTALKNPERLRASQEEHLKMIDALRAKNADELQKLMQMHISESSRYALMAIPAASQIETEDESA